MDNQKQSRDTGERIVDEALSEELRDRWIMCRKSLGLELPLIVGEYVYDFFGERVAIVEVNMFDKPENAEIVVESTDMRRYGTEFRELQWSPNRRVVDELSQRSKNEIIVNGLGT